MCVAIAQGKGAKTLTIDELETGWKTNPDGGGLAYINEDNRIVQYHTMDRDEFILTYLDAHQTYGDVSPFMVHMRIATHGKINVANNHPFHVPLLGSGEMVMMHNGILSEMNDYTNDDTTDTQAFINEVLVDVEDRWLDNPFMRDMVEDFLGSGNKLVFLTTSAALDSELYILNESLGVWDNLSWHSNYSCFDYASASKMYSSSYWDKHDDKYIVYGVTDSLGCSTFASADEDYRFYGHEVVYAGPEERKEQIMESIEKGDACTICHGIDVCGCNDMCTDCRMYWAECDCDGFVSLDDEYNRLMKESQ